MNAKLLTIGWTAILAAVLASCNGTSQEPADTANTTDTANTAGKADTADTAGTGTADPLAAGEHEWTTADGNRMPYTVTGDGDVTVLLVHCWMCNRTFWSAQVPVLAGQYRTIAVDLPGHGDATAERATWTVAGFGEDVAGMIAGLDLSNVVLVGHSMGGPVTLRAAALSGDRVRGIVAVDTLHDAEVVFTGEEMESFMAAFESDFVGTCNAFVQQMFPEEGVEEIVNSTGETMCSEEHKTIGPVLMKNFGAIDMPKWFAEAGVPIRAINAAVPNPTRIEANRQYADFDAVLVEGVGHFLHMTRPEQFNPLFQEAIEDILSETT